MFDVGFSELVLMAIVALVVLGPEKLPHAARVAGAWVGRIRRTVSNMQAEIEREVSAQEMRDRLQKEIDSVKAAGQDLNIKDSFQTITEGMQNLQGDINASLPTHADLAITDTPVIMPPVAAALTAMPAAANEIATADSSVAIPPASPSGEDAYREWLDKQKSASRRPAIQPAEETQKDTPAS